MYVVDIVKNDFDTIAVITKCSKSLTDIKEDLKESESILGNKIFEHLTDAIIYCRNLETVTLLKIVENDNVQFIENTITENTMIEESMDYSEELLKISKRLQEIAEKLSGN